MDALFSRESGNVAFVVLYGSMARGDWSRGSDFDVLVGLRRNDGVRFIDRLRDFDLSPLGDVEAFPYYLDEIEKMFRTFHLTVLASLRDGVVLYDDGTWEGYRRRHQDLLASGHLEKRGRGWKYTAEAEEMAARSQPGPVDR
jgi:predicted nucleotidyltransferase